MIQFFQENSERDNVSHHLEKVVDLDDKATVVKVRSRGLDSIRISAKNLAGADHDEDNNGNHSDRQDQTRYILLAVEASIANLPFWVIIRKIWTLKSDLALRLSEFGGSAPLTSKA